MLCSTPTLPSILLDPLARRGAADSMHVMGLGSWDFNLGLQDVQTERLKTQDTAHMPLAWEDEEDEEDDEDLLDDDEDLDVGDEDDEDFFEDDDEDLDEEEELDDE